MAADFLDGVIDVVSPPPEVELPPPVESVRPEPSPVERKTDAPAEPKAENEPAGPERDGLSDAFKKATAKADWVRRQDFKVLAIFWESRRRCQGPITAKNASVLGKELDMVIRHENVRKVIRTRLKDKIETSTVENSQPPTFQYEIVDEGVRFFETEYLSKV